MFLWIPHVFLKKLKNKYHLINLPVLVTSWQMVITYKLGVFVLAKDRWYRISRGQAGQNDTKNYPFWKHVNLKDGQLASNRTVQIIHTDSFQFFV